MTLAGQDPPPDAGQASGQPSAPTWPVIDKPSRGFRAPVVAGSVVAVIAVIFASTLVRGGGADRDPSAYPGAAATSSRSPEPVTAGAPPSAATVTEPAITGRPQSGPARTIDLTRPPDGVVESDYFRDDGFLVSGDPGVVAISGCGNARSAAVVTVAGQRFMTSSLASDPSQCNNVPLLIAFLSTVSAGVVQVTPQKPGALTMEIAYRDLSRSESTSLAVPADQARAHGGVQSLIIRPTVNDGTPVAVTKLRYAPLS